MSTQRRANGQGHTYQERNSWRTVIRHEGHVVSASAKTAADSRRRAKAKLGKLVATGAVHARLDQDLTVAEYFPAWLDERHSKTIAHGTYIRYKGLVDRYIVPGLGQVRLAKVTKADINRLFTSMAESGIGTRTQQQTRALLSVGFRNALDADLVSHNPVTNARRVSHTQRSITPLSIEETRRLLRAHEGTFMLARLHVAVLCGLRQGEALALRWSDFDEETGTLRIDKQVQRIHGVLQFAPLKTDSSDRTVVLSEHTRAALIAHREHLSALRTAAGRKWTENDLIFPNKYGDLQQRKWDHQRWLRALDACDITRRSLHSARHTAGTLLYSQSVDVETIRRTLGHSSVLLTSRTYVHTVEAPLRQAANQLDQLLAQGSESETTTSVKSAAGKRL